MKKTTALFLVFSMLFCFVSCGKAPISNSDGGNSVYPVNSEFSNINGVQGDFVETPTKLLYYATDFTKEVMGRLLCYYSRVDGETHAFCFDPLCNHETTDRKGGVETCLALMFGRAQEYGLLAYCSSNDRIYAFRGENLYSFTTFGTDLRQEYKFGKNDYWYPGFYSSVSQMHSCGRYILFDELIDDENTRLYSYDTEKKELKTVYTGRFSPLYMSGETLYFHTYSDDAVFYGYTPATDTLTEGGDFPYVTFRMNGKYSVRQTTDSETDMNVYYAITATGEEKPILRDTEDSYWAFYCADEDFIYASERNKHPWSVRKDRYIQFNCLYRISLQTGEKTILYEYPDSHISSAYMANDGLYVCADKLHTTDGMHRCLTRFERLEDGSFGEPQHFDINEEK